MALNYNRQMTMENSQLIKKQNGGYSKVYPLAYVQGIIDAETNEKLTDILIRYNHIYVPWQGNQEETRASVPLLMRRHGLWISYDKDGSLYTEWFKSSSIDALLDIKWKDGDNWEMIPNLTYINSLSQQIPDGTILPEMLSPALQEFLSEHHTIINLPDEEDLEQHCNIIRFKDRDYNEVIASGYGTKILRKNWQGRRNALVQDMILKPHTIYEVRYDFNLLGATITLPKNSVLYFTGGSLSNGTIVGDESSIIAPENQLIFSDVVIEGSWILHKVFSKWFNFTQEENVDNITNFRNMMQLATSNVMTDIYIENGTFYTSNYSTNEQGEYLDTKGISVPSNVYIHNAATIKAIANAYEKTAIFYLGDVENVTIDGGSIVGDVRTHTGTTGEWGNGIYPAGARNVVIKNIEISECWGDGIDVQALYSDYEQGTITGHCRNILLDNVKCLNNRRQGLSIEGVIGMTIRNSEFSGTGSIKYTAPGAGIDIEPWFDTEVVGDIVIENCRLFNNYASGLLLIPRDNELSKNFTFKDIVSDEGIWVRGGEDITVTNWQATGTKGYCCLWGKANNVYIANSKFTNELYCNGNLNNVQIDRCTFNMATPSWSGFAVSFQAGDSNAYQNISISNCIFTDTSKVRWINISTATSKIDFINNFIQCASRYELQLGGGDFIGNTILQMNNSRIRILNKTGNTVKILNNTFISDQYTDSMLEFVDTASIVDGTITKDYIINNNDFSKGSYWVPFGDNYNLLTVDLKYNKFNKDVRQFLPSTWTYIDGKEDEWYVSTYTPSSRNNVTTANCYCITVPNARSKVKISTSNKYTTQSNMFNTETEFEIIPDTSTIIRRPTTVGTRLLSLDNTDMSILPQFASEITEDNKVNIYISSGLSGAINLVPIIELRTQAETGPTAIKVTTPAKPTDLQFTLQLAGNLRSSNSSIQSYIEKYTGMKVLLGSNNDNQAVFNGTEWINTDGTRYNKVVIV